MDEQVYRIKMFGCFSIERGKAVLSDSAGRMQQVWNLIEYLMVHRKTGATQSDLADVLWPDDGSDNPTNALKNLAYRARTLLSKAIPDEIRPFIVFARNSYAWNPDLDYSVDIEIFENHVRAAETAASTDVLSHLMTAIGCYDGEFLPKSALEEWTIPLRTHYSSVFCDCVSRAFPLLIRAGRTGEAVQMCEKAVYLNKYDEQMHGFLIRAYMEAGDHASALKHYYYATDMFYTELGVKVSESITNLYNEITKSISSIEADLNIIEKQLHEVEAAPGAYYCPYEIFKNIYRIQSRFMLRTGQSFMVALVTMSDASGNPPPSDITPVAMDSLRDILVLSLRKSDIVSRFSPTQFVLLLGVLTYENGRMVLSRIVDKFKRRGTSFGVVVHYNLLPVKPMT